MSILPDGLALGVVFNRFDEISMELNVLDQVSDTDRDLIETGDYRLYLIAPICIQYIVVCETLILGEPKKVLSAPEQYTLNNWNTRLRSVNNLG